MKICTILILALVCLAGTIRADQAKPTNIEELPLAPSEFFWFYGIVPVDAWVAHHYVLTNSHPDTVTILKLIPGCDCTHVPSTPIVIPPGHKYLLSVQFDSRTYSGEINRDVHIVTNYSSHPEMDLYFGSFIGIYLKSVQITPMSLLFIPGKTDITVEINNASDESTKFKLYVDNDSLITVSKAEFSLKGGEKENIVVTPKLDRIPTGFTYSCLVLEIIRKDTKRVTIPIKINKF
jgi:hypothetical protein